ncbi:MAG: AAA family ATPase [Desulfobulbaceae bacterium]
MRGSSSYLKHFLLNRFPFRQQPDPEVFFAEAGRGEVLRNLCADVAAGRPLIKLTGGEGTGKTLLYLLLARKLGIKKFEVIGLDHPVGSFEELLRIVYRSLGGSSTQGQGDNTGHIRYLPEVLDLLRERSRTGSRVVLLIDGAEQLFPATLERLVRLIAEIGQERLLQILLIGRPELDRNLQQLSSYCDQVDIHAGYTLAPLDVRETAEYLSFRLSQAGCAADKAREIFTDEAISSLYHEAGGNLSLTNLVAEQALVKAYESGMFRVEADLIPPRQGTKGRSLNLVPLMARLRQYRYPVLAGSFLVLALLLLSLRPEREKNTPPAAPVEKVTPQAKEEPVVQAEIKEEPVARVEIKKEAGKAEEKTEAGTAAQATPPAEEPAAAQGASTLAERADDQKAAALETLTAKTVPAASRETAPASEAAAVPAPATEIVSLSFPEPVIVEQGHVPPEGAAETVPESSAPPEKKQVVLQADARKKKVAAVTNGKQSAVRATKDPEQLLAERLGVSSKWKARSGYTIQLMALASDTAEENFKSLLAQKRYAALQDKLYVVRKAEPPTLFVYYGYFETMEAARLERDSLPDFLRKNQPYPLSIDQAAKKAKE